MLRITHSKNANGAAKYFDEGLERADYYNTEEQSVGEWGGKAAARLGLSGSVQKEDFVALCHNQKPDGSKLNPRHSEERKVGYDFTFSVPKSVSVAYAITGNEHIREAFEQSVEATMREIETNMRTQKGQGKGKEHATTGEMVWASFTHRTSRPVDGLPDPHLHRHCFALNTTWNESAGRFQAGEFGAVKQSASYYEAAFDARMAMKMRELGYKVERRGLSWEVRGIEDDIIRKFSRRTALIEETGKQEKEKTGTLSAKQKEKLGALTRAKKLVGESWEKLRQTWRSWLSGDEANKIERAKEAEGAVEKKDGITANEAILRAQQHLFERKSVVKEYQLKAEALKRGFGDILPEELDTAMKGQQFYQRELGGQQYITTEEAVREEYKMLSHIREGRGKAFPINPDYEPKSESLNEEQRAAIRHALNDSNTVTVIAGGAGTGKTTLMKEVRDGVEEKGVKFIGFAPSAAASRGVMREEGFEQADTLAQLLTNPKLQEETKNSVIWVDEAGLIGNKDMNQLFQIAKEQNARLLLTGDVKQHSSVAAGDALRIIEKEGDIPVARVYQIQRQRGDEFYKNAVRLASEGRGDAALHQLDRIGNVVEVGDGKERLERLVTDYVASVQDGKSALIVSPTHIEGQDVTQTLRDQLRQDGHIEPEEHRFLQLKSCNWTEENKTDPWHYRQPSEKLALEFHHNADGHRKGERWLMAGAEAAEPGHVAAKGSDGQKGQVFLGNAERFTVYRQDELLLGKGDKIRITKGGKTRENSRINNGDVFTVTGFSKEGHIKLNNGKTLDKEFGHISYGYVTTSHSSQGKTVDHVFIAQSSESAAAANQQQFYVSISRGRERARIYTDDKYALEKAVLGDGERMTAREVADSNRMRRAKKYSNEKGSKKQEIENNPRKEYGKGKSV